MKTRIATLVSAVALAAMIGMGAAAPAQAQGCSRTSFGGLLGGIVGAAGGVAIGSLIGSGGGRTAAMVIGGLGGALLGNELGRRLDCSSQQKAVQTQQGALENQTTGTSSNWRNPDDNAYGSTTPDRTWTNDRGEPCRDYTSTITHQGETSTVQGTACRQQQSDGSYQWIPMES